MLKPTTLKEDQILFRATAPGGTSLASDADFIPARVADDVVPAGGVGTFSAVDARQDARRQGGRRHAVHQRDRAGHGRRQHAAGPRDDVPAPVPALHAAARRPDRVRRDGVAGAGAARQPDGEPGRRLQPGDRRGAERQQSAAAARDAGDRGPVEPRRSRWRSTRRASPTRATSRSSSSAASRPRCIKPLVETYIASLPATHAARDVARPRHHAADRRRRKTIEKGIAPKSEVAIVFSGPFEYDDAHRLALRAMTLRAAVAAARHDPPGARRHLQHHRDAARPRSSRGRNTACGSTGRATRRGRRAWCSGCSRRSSSSGTRCSRRTRWRWSATSLLREFERNSQDNGYLLNQIARRYEDGEAANVARDRQAAGPDRGADRRRDPAGGADLPRHWRNYVKVTLDAREEVARAAEGDDVSRPLTASSRKVKPAAYSARSVSAGLT